MKDMKELVIEAVANGFVVRRKYDYQTTPIMGHQPLKDIFVFNDPEDLAGWLERWAEEQEQVRPEK